MALHYAEYDTTIQNFFTDLRTQLLTSTDWARLTPDTVLLSTSANTAAAATSLPFAATAGSGLAIGSVIMIDDGALREYRTITAMTATTITVAAMTYAHTSGAPIRWGNELYKGTTTRGAQMVIDFMDVHVTVGTAAFNMAVYQSHDGTTPGAKLQRWLHFRTGTGAATHPLHVVLSAGKEHLFISVEGPRAGETGAISANYGSIRQYMFLCDLVPYDAGDTLPVVVAGGNPTNDVNGSFAGLNHMVNTSKGLTSATNWPWAKIGSIDFPKGGFGDTINMQRQRAIDGKYMFMPYVVFSEDTGMRGRLSHFFFTGFTAPDLYDAPVPPVGTKVEYQGQWYKLLAVGKTEAARHCWNQFGAVTGATAATHQRSPVVAVPCVP